MITENKRKEKGTERASKRKRENKGAGSFGPCACVMKNARAHMKCHWLFSAKKENKEKNSEQKRAEGLELSTKIFQGSIFFGPETYVTTQPRYLRNPKTKVVGQCGTQCGVLIPARNSPRSSGRAIYTPPQSDWLFDFSYPLKQIVIAIATKPRLIYRLRLSPTRTRTNRNLYGTEANVWAEVYALRANRNRNICLGQEA
jgi:hypothetical protein